jgi:cyanophycinase
MEDDPEPISEPSPQAPSDAPKAGLVGLWGRRVLRVAITYAVVGFLIQAIPLHAETKGPDNGVLFIHGGGGFNVAEFLNLAMKASKKEQPVICVITTPQGKRRAADYKRGIPFRLVKTLRERFGIEQVNELYTLSKKDANKPEFYGLIDEADAVHMSGGNQCFLTDAFLGTEIEAALNRLLERGGVVSGSSAGAQAQSSFMTRGDYDRGRIILGDKKHQQGFGFVKLAAFDVHVEERDRERDLLKLFRAKPKQLQDRQLNPLDLLGIGIDQNTAITVIRNHFRVSGRGQVYIFDPHTWGENQEEWDYYTLPSGAVFNMKTREVVDQ